MSAGQNKEAIFQTFRDRQTARREDILQERAAETETAILGTEVETSMTIEDGVAFLRSNGEREDVA
jgi:hypothetical protein